MIFTTNSIYDIIPVISDIETSEIPQQIFDKFTAFTHNFGFDYATIGLVTNPGLTNHPASHYAVSNFPAELGDKYNKDNYLLHDPVIRYALLSNVSFQWRSAKAYASIFGRKIYNEMEQLNMRDGVCIPMKIGYFPKGIISMSHNQPDFKQKDMMNLELVSIHTYTHFLKLMDARETKTFIDLSKREIEVLHYVAGGKSNWCIGQILGISEDGVKKHMTNIIRKLDASNRAHAVTLGIQSGQILP